MYAYDDSGNLLTKAVLTGIDLESAKAELRGMGFGPNGAFYVLNSRSHGKNSYANTMLIFSGAENADHTRNYVNTFTSSMSDIRSPPKTRL